MKIQLKVIESIEQFLDVTRKLQEQEPIWFRGQANAIHQLTPSLFRKTVNISIDEPYYKRERYQVRNQNYGLEQFRIALARYRDCSQLKTIDYLYLMQHYEIPTSLLDFSLDPLVALYFCVSHFIGENDHLSAKVGSTPTEIEHFLDTSGYSDKGGAIFCIKPERINFYSNQGRKEILDLNKYSFDSLKNIDFPICVKGNSVDERINAQKGVFAYFGNFIHPLDWYDITQPDIVKIFVPNSLKRKIKVELREKYKICHSTMFPDMKGVSLEIIDIMNEEFALRTNS